MSPNLKFSLLVCERNCDRFMDIVRTELPDKCVRVYYALKANGEHDVLRTIFGRGLGAEVITEIELDTAISAGVHFVVNGHYKTDRVLERAILGRADMINVESVAELLRIEKLAGRLGVDSVNVGIRIKAEPARILGLSRDGLAALGELGLKRCVIRGLHLHAGWNVKNHDKIAVVLNELAAYYELMSALGIQIDTFNLGGSFCEASVDPDQLRGRVAMYRSVTPLSVVNVHFEPGRYIVGDCGILEGEVVEIRDQVYCINTCAYGFHLSGATPRVSINPCRRREKDFPSRIVLSGHWPSEEDRFVLNDSEYTPEVGDRVLFHNFGAYCSGWGHQFEFNNGLEYDYVTNLMRATRAMDQDEREIVTNFWDHFRDSLAEVPRDSHHLRTVLRGVASVLDPMKSYSESEVHGLLREYCQDCCTLLDQLIRGSYLVCREGIYSVQQTQS